MTPRRDARRSRSFVLAAIAALGLACRSDPEPGPEGAPRASEQARDVVRRIREQQARELAHEREVRLGTLRGILLVAQTQPMIISSLSAATPLTRTARAEVQDKLERFQMRIDETANAIEAWRHAAPERWDEHEAAVTDSVERLEAARDAAWNALRDGARLAPS